MRSRAWLCLLFLLAVSAASSAGAQSRETRVALIIANEAYVSPNLGRLPGTRGDAAVMRAALERAGFEVTVRTDLTRQQMRAELSTFVRRLAEIQQNGVGFLYYSGHGMADSDRGQNYLIPVDAEITGVTDLPTNAIALNEQLDSIDLARAKSTILVIDACRNTPVAINRSGSRGLAPMRVSTDTLIAYSTQAGATAADDGVYARALANEITKAGADAINAFARVTAEVARATNRTQVPRYDNGLIEPLVFIPPAASSDEDPVAADEQAWTRAQRLSAEEGMGAPVYGYLLSFPEGRYVNEATALLRGPAPPYPDLRTLLAQRCGTATEPLEASVYFEWDRSNLNAASLETIDAFARRFNASASRLLVVGWTDKERLGAYSLGLTQRRANVVRDALVARGVGNVEAIGMGIHDAPVPTAYGVREPQNRVTRIFVC